MRRKVKDFLLTQGSSRIYNRAMDYVAKNPEVNLLKFLNYAKIIAPQFFSFGQQTVKPFRRKGITRLILTRPAASTP